MAGSSGKGSQYTALMLLDYLHAPLVGFYLLGALTFSTCTLQKAKPISHKRRRISLSLVFTILTTHLAECLYYAGKSAADTDYEAPEHAVVHCLGSILLWAPLSFSLFKTEKLFWHAYFGAFVMEFFVETTLCLLGGIAVYPKGAFEEGPLAFSSIRSLVALLLMLDGFLILMQKSKETGTDEEGQSLLGNKPNASEAATPDSGYGSIPQDPAASNSDHDDDDEEGDSDRDKEIKEAQAKRLKEQGGWVGYLKGFAIFIPYIWPKDDWKMILCLVVRGLYLIQGRVLNLLTPRQIGIITDKLSLSTPVMPWHDIGLWLFYTWFNSYAGVGILDNIASYYIQNTARERLNALTFRHVMSLSMDFHTNKSSGEVIKAVEQATSLNNLIELVFFEVCPILVDLLVAMWYVSHLFNIYMAFIILFMGAIYVWLGIYFTAWSQEKRRTYQEKARFESTTIYEAIPNWLTVSYFNRHPYEQERYGAAVRGTINAQWAYLFRSLGGHSVQSLVMNLGYAGCCIFAMWQIVYRGRSVGSLITFMMYWDTMMSPLWMMSYSYRHISSSLIDAERALQLLNTKPTVTDPEKPEPLHLKSTKVEFKDVDFSYDPRKPVLKDVNFTAESGQTVAFVGETGGGKSTMLKLLLRAWDVTAGSIQIGTQDLRSILQSDLHDAIGVVPQDPTLFNQTILDNVRYARLEATQQEVEDACRAAAIHDTIMSFPDKYKSKVGERGVKLSGGQLQRIAIARVFLKNPAIVLLDEATSAVDSAIEAQIQDAFRTLSKGRTTFVIAHRLSTIVDADQILVVDKGEIIERGSHAELLERGGKYAELWAKQTAGALSGVNSKAGSTFGDGEEGGEGKGPLIDVTPPEEEGQGRSTGRDGGVDGGSGEGVERRKKI
ncbi:hypothetical protein EJ04DRAFT_523665 [Polyplosphaeria fusca]|uniref:Uncharacterized protein n=1 Tax=Polyplosphaeria fusca TaxID=682080 RepID=A0A9P4R065_9PLEO|nr:hypothetical protein EJ04DRAFT_523665 [Polyplosphaeria fusca]